MKELYSKAKNIANSTGKSFNKLAMLTMLGTGLVVGSGISDKVEADMSYQEYHTWRALDRMYEYEHNAVIESQEKARKERERKSNEKTNSINRGHIDFFAFTKEGWYDADGDGWSDKTDKGIKNVSYGDHIIFCVDFNNNYRDENISREFYIINKKNEVMHYEENVGSIKSNFVYPNNEGISLPLGDYTAIFKIDDSKPLKYDFNVTK